MSSVYYYEPMESLLELMNGRPTHNHHLQRHTPGAGMVSFLKPRMDLHEDSNNNTVTASFELPGLTKEDVSIDVHSGRLIISGESKSSADHEEHGYAIRERQYGKFSRTLQLPQGVKEDEISAHMDSGVLTVSFPKTSPELTPKKITIS